MLTSPSPLSRLAFAIGWWLRGIAAPCAMAGMVLMAGCGSELRQLKTLPGEARVFVADQNTLWEACRPSRADDGSILRADRDAIAGCYDPNIDTIFLEDSCQGARAWSHERAHRAGIKDPSKEGYDWP